MLVRAVLGSVMIENVGITEGATVVESFLTLDLSVCGLDEPVVMACVADCTACSCCLATANSVGGVGNVVLGGGCLLLGDFWTGDF